MHFVVLTQGRAPNAAALTFLSPAAAQPIALPVIPCLATCPDDSAQCRCLFDAAVTSHAMILCDSRPVAAANESCECTGVARAHGKTIGEWRACHPQIRAAATQAGVAAPLRVAAHRALVQKTAVVSLHCWPSPGCCCCCSRYTCVCCDATVSACAVRLQYAAVTRQRRFSPCTTTAWALHRATLSCRNGGLGGQTSPSGRGALRQRRPSNQRHISDAHMPRRYLSRPTWRDHSGIIGKRLAKLYNTHARQLSPGYLSLRVHLRAPRRRVACSHRPMCPCCITCH